MTYFLRTLPYFILAFLNSFSLIAQNTSNSIPTHGVYLIGNTANANLDNLVLRSLQKQLEATKFPAKLLFLGDLIDHNGLVKSSDDNNLVLLRKLSEVSQKNKNIQTYFLSGDRDWDNSGPNGVQNIHQLAQQLTIAGAELIPKDACPGPISIELDDLTTLIIFNSQWFMHPHDRPVSPDTDCPIISEFDFWDELKDHLDDAEGKNVLLAAHHPIYSGGQYAGKKLSGYHAIPIIGTMYVSYRQQIGNTRDMSNAAYQNFNQHLREILQDYPSVIYASGHEMDLQVQQIEDHYHLNSGAATTTKSVKHTKNHIFSSSEKGYMKLEYFADGQVQLKTFTFSAEAKEAIIQNHILYLSPCSEKSKAKDLKLPYNRAYDPCYQENVQNSNNSFSKKQFDSTIAGPEYQAKKFRKSLMGTGYRKEWTQKLQVPVLDLEKTFGGLTPYATGGGLQTNSLKFTAKNCKKYAFRSINKDPVRGLDELSKQTIYKNIVKDLITTQHPYGGLVASKLMDATDILHSQPALYLMPNDPRLKQYASTFGGLLGTLEYRPGSAKKKSEEIGKADDIDSSNKMFRTLYKDNDNRVDPKSFARARIFDFFVGDWDRHEDNWKWAQYKIKKGNIFKPIPRDRDHVFSKWTGLIPSIADKVIPNAENFGDQFDNIQQLSFKARHLDRQLGNSLNLADWKAAAEYIETQMTDEVIDTAILELPKEIGLFSGDEISRKLKSRRTQLVDAASQLYQLLAKEVDVIGSNKKEIFEIERLDNGNVKVQMFDAKKKSGKKGKLVYERIFHKNETKEIRLFGLGKADQFFLKGEGKNKSILVRIIGGKGEDKIVDQSKANGFKKRTLVYDSEREDLITSGPETKIKRPAQIAKYNNKSFEYSYLAPLPKFRISSGNGFGAEMVLTYYKLGFNKPDYHQKFEAKLILYTINAQRLDLKNWHRHLFGKWDLLLHARLSSLYDKFPFFYGIGNATILDDDLQEENYYRTDFNTVQFSPTLIRSFWRKSQFNIGFRYEFNDVNPKNSEKSIFYEERYLQIDGTQKQNLLGLTSSLNIDFRDNPLFTRRGSQFFIRHEMFHNFSSGDQFFGKVEGHIAHYMTAGFATLAIRGSLSSAYGNPPFYHLSSIGSHNYQRAYFRNRFLGDKSATLSNDIRFHLGSIRTAILPIKWGIYGFYDIGRVWSVEDGADISRFHTAYGGGLYAAPLSENFAFTFTIGNPDRDDDLYFRVSLGFDLQ